MVILEAPLPVLVTVEVEEKADVARSGAAGPKASTLLVAKKAAKANVLTSFMVMECISWKNWIEQLQQKSARVSVTNDMLLQNK